MPLHSADYGSRFKTKNFASKSMLLQPTDYSSRFKNKSFMDFSCAAATC